jgi:hypothetical protein
VNNRIVQDCAFTKRAPIAEPSLLGHLRARTKLALALSTISGLVIASAIAATIGTSYSDAKILRSFEPLLLPKYQSFSQFSGSAERRFLVPA